MPKFDKQFVYFIWDDELKGKICFVADSIDELKEAVERNDIEFLYTVANQHHGANPFQVENGIEVRFCYYDPNYSIKIAHEQGKKIECKRKGDAWGDLDWDYTPSPEWLDDHEYRIMQEEENPVTHLELARWLAQGRGEWRWYNVSNVTPYAQIDFRYSVEEAFHPVKRLVLVRKWADEDWHEPTRKYMGLEK